ncbi:ABC transporter ATP-binding protein [Pseudorhizobium marinum]|uniref:ABC transporter ATP-binding protein n=1 Tax=Pseudorhizobium marinum TaxID=1496690 RepID=UPI000497B998|nr:ABC transporter ATP-binding protein [Pseudorhizobium marinum]
MSVSDAVYRPFETLIRPLDIPYSPLPTSGPFAVLLHFVRIFRWVLLTVALSSVIVEIVNLFLLWGISVIVDGIAAEGARAFLQQDWPFLALLVALAFPITPLLIFVNNTLASQSLVVCMPAAIQWQGHKAVERQDLAFFHDLFAGQVASRLSQVASAVQQQVVVAFQTVPFFAVQFVGSLVLLGALAWPLAVPVLLWIVANAFVAVRAVPQFSERGRKSAKQRSLVVGAMTDLYSNIQTVKLFAAEDSEAGSLRGILGKTIDTQQWERRIYLTTDIAVITLNVLLWLGVFWIGFWGLIDGFVTTGQFVTSLYIAQRLQTNARGFLQICHQIFQAVGTIKDAMPVMTTPPTVTDRADAKPLAVTAGAVQFDKLHFAYRKDRGVIDDLSLEIRPGEKVGLVGISGAGKSTLVSLLLRFYDLDGGAIRIDGQDIRDVTQASLREQIGVITQDVALLHRSVGDNIRYGRPDASREEIERAAALAQADGFIADLKDNEGRSGYDAFVGDRGIKLSGGQRQRVAIARALLKDAPILVLDEATSALDSESEAAVQQNLSRLMAGKTVIAIAHRLSTIAEMDRIVVIEKGRILEEGKPEELLARDGLYARLWKRQTGGYIADAIEEA